MNGKTICLALFCVIVAGMSVCAQGCALLQRTPEPVKAAAIECGTTEIQHAIRDVVCGSIDPPAQIAARVAQCIAERSIERVFGGDNFCAGYVKGRP